MSGELGERAPDALTTGSAHKVSDNGDAVTCPQTESFACGLNGSVTVSFGEAPAEPEPESVDKRPSWLRTMRHGGGLRWKRNGRSSR
jgi:hypothetical protein